MSSEDRQWGECLQQVLSPFSLKEDTMEDRRIKYLYKLLDRAIREHDSDAESSLRWAIFTLENYCGKS